MPGRRDRGTPRPAPPRPAPPRARFRPSHRRIDVLIPTFERPGALAVTLAGLVGQGLPLRVVISDQGSRPATDAAEVRTLLRVLGARGHRVAVRRHLPPRGLAEQRAFLLSLARGRFALFLDDDIFLEPGALPRLVATIRRQGCAFVGAAPIGLGYAGDVRPAEQALEPWDGPVRPEVVVPRGPEWARHRLHNAANPWHVGRTLARSPGAALTYKVAWVGGCVLWDVRRLRAVGGFDFWRDLPEAHAGEDVVPQLRAMARFGGCAVLPSGAYHLELPTTIQTRDVDAPHTVALWAE